MKIQFISNYSDLYGANRSLFSIIEYFHNKGYKVNVVLPSKGGMSDRLEEKKIPFQIIPYYSAFLYIKPVMKHLLVPILGILNLLIFPILILKVKKFNPDIIYSNTSAENLGVFVAKILKKKHISHIREFMSLDHNSFFIFGKKAKRKFINLSDGCIYVSNAVLDNVQGYDRNDEKHVVIYNGIVAAERSLTYKKLDMGSVNFGIVGVLDPSKGQHIAIDYFSTIVNDYPNTKLLIYGDKEGSYKKQLIKQVVNLNLTDSVKFCGFVSNPKTIYESIDVMLMFSRSEGFGRVTIEAALKGVPVIGFDNAGTSELILDKETGCLFSDYNSFLTSLNFILTEENYPLIREKSFENALKVYDVTTYCENIEKYVLKIVNL